MHPISSLDGDATNGRQKHQLMPKRVEMGDLARHYPELPQQQRCNSFIPLTSV